MLSRVLALLLVVGCRAPFTETGSAPETGLPEETGRSTETGSVETGGTDTGDTGVGPEWPDAALVLRGAMLVDADGARGPSTVVVDGARIAWVSDVEVEAPSDATVVDLTGAWLAPGLVDPHVHLFQGATPWFIGSTLENNLKAQLYFGVTSVVDVGGPIVSYTLRDRIAEGELVGPSMKALGPMLTEPGSHPCEVWNDPHLCRFASDVETAVGHVDELMNAGSDGLKAALADADFTPWPTPRLDVEVLTAAAARTHDRGGLVFAHVDEEDDALEALAAGADHLAHPVFGGALSASGTEALAVDAPAIHTTVSAFVGVAELLEGTTDLERLEAVLDPAIVDAWTLIRREPSILDAAWVEEASTWADVALANLDALDAAGAVLIPASDAGYWYVPPGLGLHRELAALEAIGWSTQRVLTAATRDAAASVGWSDRGLIRADQRADLLILDANPLADLAALSRPSAIVLAGEYLDRAAIPSLPLLRASGGAARGDFCLDAADCASGDCDRTDHVCRRDCPTPYAVSGACSSQSWCAPSDGLPSTTDGVCHVDPPCDLYDTRSCSPNWYDEVCVPADLDSSYCWPSGERAEGESCSYAEVEAGCQPGLFCSWIDDTCYRLCDPALGVSQPDVCGTAACVTQRVGARDWFGLCF